MISYEVVDKPAVRPKSRYSESYDEIEAALQALGPTQALRIEHEHVVRDRKAMACLYSAALAIALKLRGHKVQTWHDGEKYLLVALKEV